MGAYPRDTGSNPVEGNGHFFPSYRQLYLSSFFDTHTHTHTHTHTDRQTDRQTDSLKNCLSPWQHEASVVRDVKRFGPLALLQLLQKEVTEEGPVVRNVLHHEQRRLRVATGGGGGETNF